MHWYALAYTAGRIKLRNTCTADRRRVEHIIGEVKKHNTTGGRWRGSYELIQAMQKIVVHMTTLQERITGPRYDVFGPWPHHPLGVVTRRITRAY